MAAAESNYGRTNHLLYLLERGTTLHLAGRYQESNELLEQADQLVEDAYTHRLRDEVSALVVNDNQRPFVGDSYEHVMINIMKALNYGLLGNLDEALVEARKLDHRMNVLHDSREPDDYHEDPFARYLSGILYEAAGDANNAFIAYRKAYDAYESARSWIGLSLPRQLQQDLLRVTEMLGLLDEHERYRELFPGVRWVSANEVRNLAQVVIIGFSGQAPRLEDQYFDLPISLQALQLVLQTKSVLYHRPRGTRAVESVIYGLNGHVVRVALPRITPTKSAVESMEVMLEGGDEAYHGRSDIVHNVTATAQKGLSDRFAAITVRAVARAALKLAAAEGVGAGVAQASNKPETQHIIRAIVSAIARIFAISTEEADKRSWRTLPDEIHLTRLWVKPGTYVVHVEPLSRLGKGLSRTNSSNVTLRPGQFSIITQRFVF